MLVSSFNLLQSFNYAPYLIRKKRFKSEINCFCIQTLVSEKTVKGQCRPNLDASALAVERICQCRYHLKFSPSRAKGCGFIKYWW